ncbi:MAG: DNA polymerase III subunit alpha, partial [Thermodesulfobacteriota bacterium]
MSDNFVHLHLHSQYSLLDGAIKFEELADRTKEFGMEAVAMTDHGNLFGAYEFYEKAKQSGVKPIIGCEVYVTPTLKLEKPSDGKTFHLTVLCMNETGYKNLSNLVTKGYFEGFYRRPRVDHQLLDKHNEGLIVFSGCMSSELSRALFKKDHNEAVAIASKYREIFGDRYYLEVQATGLPEQNFVNRELKKLSNKLGIPLIATNDCHFLKQEDARPHDALLCVQTGSNLNEEKRFKFAGDQFFLKSRQQMEDTLKGFDDAIEKTLEVADRCDFEFKTEGYKFPEFEIPEGTTLDGFIKDLANKKLSERITENSIPDDQAELYKERLNYELEIICQMGFPAYFLVVADFINYAKSSGIPVGPGRGSAAGSLVAYALGITDIDPIPYDLIFERFLNPERISMPDIDVDFCTEGRDKVIEYVTSRYGRDKVAQIGTFGTMSSKAVIKDVGRVLGIPYGDVDRISKLIPSFRGKVFSIDEALQKVPQITELVDNSEQLQELIELAKPLENMVRHASTHAAGVVISNEPISDYIPLYKGSRDETVTQFDMNCIEKLGYVKFDFLGLKTLTVINKAVNFINESLTGSEKKLDINKIPLDDTKLYRLLDSGNTRGVFQIESSGMKELLTRLKANSFEDLIAVLALYRPGPLDSGMVDEFVKRKHGKKEVDFPHPKLKEILKDTYGLFV